MFVHPRLPTQKVLLDWMGTQYGRYTAATCSPSETQAFFDSPNITTHQVFRRIEKHVKFRCIFNVRSRGSLVPPYRRPAMIKYL